jgi:hypothetical protein
MKHAPDTALSVYARMHNLLASPTYDQPHHKLVDSGSLVDL